MAVRLFVYGTLQGRVDQYGSAMLEGRATIQGELYDLGNYPGAIPSPTSSVSGEIWLLQSPDTMLSRIDGYEGYNAEDEASSLFRRVAVVATAADGTPRIAWAYYYNRPVETHRRIFAWQPTDRRP